MPEEWDRWTASRKEQGDDADGSVGNGHDIPAVEPVGKGAGEQRQDPLGKHAAQHGHGEYRGRACPVGQIPDEGILREHAGKDGAGLAHP